MDIIFATNNKHKVKEIRELLNPGFRLLGLSDVDINEEVPEDENTLEGNALFKAKYVHDRTGMNVFADDTGLEVEALDGAPGVHSARFAGNDKDSSANIEKLLGLLDGKENRKARFRTVIALIMENKEYLFEGIVNGKIIDHKRGDEGFGYDPVFVADGFTKTFAEIPLAEKNLVSHRAMAFKKLLDFLENRSVVQ
jgi:XTP/dITP diphosphohydrolase